RGSTHPANLPHTAPAAHRLIAFRARRADAAAASPTPKSSRTKKPAPNSATCPNLLSFEAFLYKNHRPCIIFQLTGRQKRLTTPASTLQKSSACQILYAVSSHETLKSSAAVRGKPQGELHSLRLRIIAHQAQKSKGCFLRCSRS